MAAGRGTCERYPSTVRQGVCAGGSAGSVIADPVSDCDKVSNRVDTEIDSEALCTKKRKTLDPTGRDTLDEPKPEAIHAQIRLVAGHVASGL